MYESGQPEGERRLADGAGGGIGLTEFRLDFTIDGLRVIEVIGQRGMDFRKSQVRILAHDLIGGPSAAKVIRDDLGDADPRGTQKSGRFAGFQMKVWVLDGACHERKRWFGNYGFRQERQGGRWSGVAALGCDKFRRRCAMAVQRFEQEGTKVTKKIVKGFPTPFPPFAPVGNSIF